MLSLTAREGATQHNIWISGQFFLLFQKSISTMAAGKWLTDLRGLLIVTPWALYLVVMDLILSILLPISYLFPNWVYDVSSFVAFTNWYWIQCIFEVFNGAKITMSGDVLPEGESAIVIANHVSWTDFYMIQALAIRSGMLGRCRWFAKIELRWVPLLGWGIWAMGMPMVSRKWTKDKKELDRVFAGITVRKWPTCKHFLLPHEPAFLITI
jgi:1-acyl-sn-glycerol-3-phosphate acyltransferase